MAPWRVAKPRNLQQLPRFLSYEPGSGEEREGPAHIESAETLAIRHGIGRAEQDAYALRSYLKAEQAREHKRFVGEIAPLRANPEEARDQSSMAPDFKDLAQLAPYTARRHANARQHLQPARWSGRCRRRIEEHVDFARQASSPITGTTSGTGATARAARSPRVRPPGEPCADT